jgi:hypothetical protein
MISASSVQAILLGSGGFLGTCMAGVGAYKLFSATTRGMMRVPISMEKGAECLERVVRAVETQNLVSQQVMELKALLMATREEILKIGTEREQIGRELRLMSRKIEGFSCYAQDELK